MVDPDAEHVDALAMKLPLVQCCAHEAPTASAAPHEPSLAPLPTTHGAVTQFAPV